MPKIFRPVFASLLIAIAILAIVVHSGWSQSSSATPVAPEFAPGFQSITETQSRQMLSFLVGPNTLGRNPVQPGFAVAAGYVTHFLQQAGLNPILPDGSYLQRIQFIGTRIPSFSLQTQDDAMQLSSLKETVFAQFAPTQEASGIPIFLSIKKGATQLPAGVSATDFKDKILVLTVVDQLPSEAPESKAVEPLLKAGSKMTVVAGDLAGIIAVTPRDPPWSLVFADAGSIAFDANRPPQQTVFIDQAMVPALMTASGAVPAPGTATMIPVAVGTQQLLFKFGKEKETRPVESMNVLAFIEGSDRQLKSEVIGIGAHLDHMGMYLNGSILNGADDNGSGSTALLNVARAMMVNPVRPRRSVLFLLFTGEEEGELGSQYYVEHPVIPHRQMIAMLNMDMVGRNSEKQGITPAQASQLLYLGSASCFPNLESAIVEANRAVGLQLEVQKTDCNALRKGNAGSDHANFARVNIPVAFFSTGLHKDYHRPGDTLDKINFQKLTAVSRLIYLSVQNLANREPLNLRTPEAKS